MKNWLKIGLRITVGLLLAGSQDLCGAAADKAAKSGSGVMTVAPASVSASSTTNFAFRCLVKNGVFNSGSQVTLQIPALWAAPQTGNVSQSGFVRVYPVLNDSSVRIVSISGNGPWTITLEVATARRNGGFDLSYENVTAPGQAAVYLFKVQTAQNGGRLVDLKSGSPSVTVTNPAKVNTTVTVNSSSDTTVYGQVVNFSAQVAGANAGIPTGTATFRDGDAVLGTIALDGAGRATLSANRFSVEFSPAMITVEYSGDASFNGSISAPLAQAVTPATVTLAGLTADSKEYDGGVAAPLNYGAASLTGLLVGDSISLATAGATAVFADPNVGTAKPVSVAGLALEGVDAANYVLSAPATVTADVTARTLMVSANSATRHYGEPNPAFTAAYAGFVAGEGQEVLSGAPEFSTTATASSPAQSSPYAIAITQGTLAARNYTFMFVPGWLTITPASITSPASSPAAITALVKAADGGIRLSIRGAANQTYRIQASSNLKDWSDIGSGTANAEGSVEFADPDNTERPLRFYRAVLP